VLSRVIYKKRRGRRPLAAGAALTVFLGTFLIAGIALAVHDLAFQLDGDVSASTGTNIGGNPQTQDWDSFFNADTSEKALPANFTASGFVLDFNTKVKNGATVFNTFDGSTYATGSKDTLDIDPGWQCSTSNNVLTKNDIMNAYAVAYTNPVPDANGKKHQILYFGMERNGNNGDANVGFWFLQGEANCDASNGTAGWTGHHADGDVLIVSAFTNGGGVSGITAYRWSDADGPGGVAGFLDPNAVGNGGDCQGAAGLDAICATTNGSAAPGLNAAITTPWLTANGSTVGHTLAPSEFFEGAIDLTAENLGDHCFNTFVGDTRSSQSLTATIFDYARGVLGECTSTTSTNPVDATDTSQPPATAIPGDPLDALVTVKDKTIIDVTGLDTFSGSISWHICGPTAAASTVTCDTGGVDVGSQNITVDGTYYSPTARVTAAGRYCFRAEFSGDTTAGVPGSSDHDSSECFTVAPRQPTLETQATTGPVTFGSKISDTVTIANTAHKPGTGGPTGSTLAGSINPTTLGGDATGDITVVAYGPNSCSTVAFTSTAIAASGNGSYGGAGTAFEFTPSAPGQYVFVAAFAGDLPNTLGIPATACSGAPASEKVTVQQIPTQIKTKQSWIPNDTATISATSGNLAAGGTVAFSLYNNATCTGTAAYSQNVVLVGGNPTEEVKTTNTGGATGFTITTGYADAANSLVGRYSWKVTYTPAAADTAHTGIQSACDVEHFNITYTNDNGPGTALP
jgi:hypothetical protein